MPASPVLSAAIVALATLCAANPAHLYAQDEMSREEILADTSWQEFKQVKYSEKPILLHLRTAQERAIIWPEPIEFLDENQILPGCAVVIDNDVVGFFPTRSFQRTAIKFKGLETGTVYELRARATEQGMIEPLQISR